MLTVIAVLVCFVPILSSETEQDKKAASEEAASNINSLCYVCHHDLQTEQITTVHLKNGIGCDKCHGPSNNHMHDEMLMTKPDRLFGRAEVEGMCLACHQPHKDPEAVQAFRNEWSGRTRPNGRTVTPESICTDCHGTHNIVKRAVEQPGQEQKTEWTSLFNGRDLTGWMPKGNASWTVKNHRIMAKPGPDGAGGDLWTEALYKDYRLSVTFRAAWPIRGGIWLRGWYSSLGPRVEISESKNPRAFTGSVTVDGPQMILGNLRQDLLDKEGWNTISVEVRENRFQVWLNGEEIGAFRFGEAAPGKIGFHIEGHPENKDAALTISEVTVQRLGEPERTGAGAEQAGLAPIFNGKDLTGWKIEGGARWVVEDKNMIGMQGPNNEAGDLLTEKTYKDFLLTVTYKIEWPCNSGIWFRYQSPDKAYQADILEYKNPECYSGTLYCPGKMFLAMNTDKTLVDREGWNKISIRAEGSRLQIWINARQVADVRDQTSESGRIGFQIHAGDQLSPNKIVIREVLLKPL